MDKLPREKRIGRPANRDRLPEGIRRTSNRRLLVDFQERFPDGTAFRRTKDFDPEALKLALNFLARAQAEFARGNGVGGPTPAPDLHTVGGWCRHCVDVAMPAQKNGRSPKYSDDALEAFRGIVRDHIAPQIGLVNLLDLNKTIVSSLIRGLPSDEVRTKVLNVLTRSMQLAESKGQRKKGTNPCKGVSASLARLKGAPSLETPANWTSHRPENWRELESE